MTNQKRAQKGGEVGVNGFFYQGGQYLPSTQMRAIGKSKLSTGAKKLDKQEIAPYVWEMPKSENHKSIYSLIRPGVFCTWAKGFWIERLEFCASDQTIDHYNLSEEDIAIAKSLIEAWNNGERWIIQV